MIYSICKCDTCRRARYLLRAKRKGLERAVVVVGRCRCKPLLGSKAKPLLSKQSVKFKCQTWHKITKKLAKKCLDASSL